MHFLIFLLGFGDDMIKTLVDHFDTYLDDPDTTQAEWPLLRTAVFDM